MYFKVYLFRVVQCIGSNVRVRRQTEFYKKKSICLLKCFENIIKEKEVNIFFRSGKLLKSVVTVVEMLVLSSELYTFTANEMVDCRPVI